MLSAIACSRSWLNPLSPAPCSKQVAPCEANCLHTSTHSSKVFGGREPVLGEQVGVDPDRAGEGRADGEGGEFAVLRRQAGGADRSDFRLPVGAERLRDAGRQVDRRALVGLDRTDSAARRHVEHVGADRGGERRPDRGVVAGRRDLLVGHLDVGVDLVELLDVLLADTDLRRPSPPGDGSGCGGVVGTAGRPIRCIPVRATATGGHRGEQSRSLPFRRRRALKRSNIFVLLGVVALCAWL